MRLEAWSQLRAFSTNIGAAYIMPMKAGRRTKAAIVQSGYDPSSDILSCSLPRDQVVRTNWPPNENEHHKIASRQLRISSMQPFGILLFISHKTSSAEEVSLETNTHKESQANHAVENSKQKRDIHFSFAAIDEQST